MLYSLQAIVILELFETFPERPAGGRGRMETFHSRVPESIPPIAARAIVHRFRYLRGAVAEALTTSLCGTICTPVSARGSSMALRRR